MEKNGPQGHGSNLDFGALVNRSDDTFVWERRSGTPRSWNQPNALCVQPVFRDMGTKRRQLGTNSGSGLLAMMDDGSEHAGTSSCGLLGNFRMDCVRETLSEKWFQRHGQPGVTRVALPESFATDVRHRASASIPSAPADSRWLNSRDEGKTASRRNCHATCAPRKSPVTVAVKTLTERRNISGGRSSHKQNRIPDW